MIFENIDFKEALTQRFGHQEIRIDPSLKNEELKKLFNGKPIRKKTFFAHIIKSDQYFYAYEYDRGRYRILVCISKYRQPIRYRLTHIHHKKRNNKITATTIKITHLKARGRILSCSRQ